ncbi:MAG: acyltransferase family protein [Terracidiphilus sp.]|nr:acyltransferase family protein [Terracidiphilus sp.]
MNQGVPNASGTLATTPALAADPNSAPRRREYGLDWLRVIAFVILIGYHTGMYFVPWPWSVKNRETSEWLTWVMILFNHWRLPLLFFISGAGTWFNLRRRGYGNFALERTRRLLLPLAFGMFVIIPPQIYVERILAGWHYASYFDFWGTVFTFVAYPQGNLSWHHLWFLPYIFTYSLLGLPLFALLRSTSGRALVERLARLCERPGWIYLVNVPNIAVALLLGPHWPATNNLTSDWANFTGSLLTFLWGFIICGNDRFLALVERRRREFLIVSAAMLVLFYGIRLDHVLAAFSGMGRAWIFTLVDSYFGMAVILTLVGWSRSRLNRDSSALRYANTAVYPFYIFHQTITVLLGYAWIDWRVPFAIKFPLLFAGTFLGSWALFEVTRRNAVTRLLFGMKP